LSNSERVVWRLDKFRRRDRIQGPREAVVDTRTVRARSQMTLNGHQTWPVFTVVMQDEFIVTQVTHGALL
jgi:hypothetical protein